MTIHKGFLAGTPRCVHGDALAGGVQHIAKEALKGQREYVQAIKDILRMVDEYTEGRTKVEKEAAKFCRSLISSQP